ncbi:unnamed protein product [Acanthoscelides obtectus]|uniref:DDE Tnp4 domain-containing protein n=1 Tax=Acanthoscelides obtectus TaxID=200917 RepID=A0A9P0LTU5_ACAOB|nr:unnamed protein product [Acanthoscelides obtectus]CAK1634034.1 hypothetical protein AOBTE_LOCUS8554 [Acanthoscelides obtectus]
MHCNLFVLKACCMVPKTEEGWKQVAQDFEEKWNFHNCVGSVDGKHVGIQQPSILGLIITTTKGSIVLCLRL